MKNQCTAKSKHTGAQCKQTAINGTTKCRFHGGASLRGIAHPNYKTGRHSNALPTNLRGLYEEGLTDPELIQLRSEISLLDVRINQLTVTVAEGETDRWWKQVRKLWKDVMFAARTGNEVEQMRLQAELGKTIEEGSDQRAAWNDIADLIERRRKLSETEQRRMVAAQQMLTIEQAMLMLSATINALREAVYLYADATTARHILNEAQTRYGKVISLQPGSGADVGVMGEAT